MITKRRKSKPFSAKKKIASINNFSIYRLKGALATIKNIDGITVESNFYKIVIVRQLERFITEIKNKGVKHEG